MPIEMNENFPIQKHNAPMVEYRRAANETITKFTNEMSEILRNSIKRLDNISLKVRNCVYTIEARDLPKQQINMSTLQEEFKKSQQESEADPVVAVIEYRRNSEVNIRKQPDEEKKKEKVDFPKGSTIQVDKVVEKLKPKKMKRAEVSFPSNPRKKRHIGTVIDREILKEQSVIHRIIESQKEVYKPKTGKSSREGNVRDKAEIKRRKRANIRKLLMQRAILNKQGQRVADCYLNENFEDNLWFGAKIHMNTKEDQNKKPLVKHVERIRSTSVRKPHKILKLARKKANENFHDDKPFAEKIFSVDNKISTRSNTADKNDEWRVIMETQKTRPARYELKQNCPFAVNNILDEVTLKDLEPLKAEYPRRDHLITADINVDDKLLYKLLHDRKSLEYLVDVTSTTEPSLPIKRRHKLCRTPYTKHVHNDFDNIPEESCLDSPDLISDSTKRLLNKYILAPEGANKTFLVLPVLVQFNKDITPHFSSEQTEDRKRKCIYTDATRPDAKEILRPYIFSKDNPVEVPEATVMTVSPKFSQNRIPSPQRKPKMIYNAGGNNICPGEKDTVLVRKMVPCDKKYKKNCTPRNLEENKLSNSQQLVSFIVDKDKRNSVEQMHIPPVAKPPRKYPSANFRQFNHNKIERCESTISEKRYKGKKKEQEENTSECPQEKQSYFISAKSTPKTANLNIENCEFSVLHDAKSRNAKKNFQKMKAEHVLKTTSAITKKILSKWQSLENPSIVDVAKNISKDKLTNEEKIGELELKQKSLEKFPVVDVKVQFGKTLEKGNVRKVGKGMSGSKKEEKIENLVEEKKVKEKKVEEIKEEKVVEEKIATNWDKNEEVQGGKMQMEEEYNKDERNIFRKKIDVNYEEFKTKEKKKSDFKKRKTPLESRPQTNSPNEKLQIKPNRMQEVPTERIPVPESIFPTCMLKNAYPPRFNFTTHLKESPKFEKKMEFSPRNQDQIPVKDVGNNVGNNEYVGMWMEVNDNSSLIQVKTPKIQKTVNTTVNSKELNQNDIEELEKQLGEETKKFCQEVDEVFKQIQEAPVIKIPTPQDSFLDAASHILSSPFIQAVNKLQSENNMEDFLNYLEKPTKNAIFIFLPRQMSSVKLIPNVLCFAKYYGPTCEVKKWTDSELNIAIKKEDIKLDLKVVDSVSFPVLQDYIITDKAEETIMFNTEDLIWVDESTISDIVQQPHQKLLACVYTAVFATVFCSLNLKYHCD